MGNIRQLEIYKKMSNKYKLLIFSIIALVNNIIFYNKLMKDYALFNYLKVDNYEFPYLYELTMNDVKVTIINNFELLGYEYIILIVISFILILLIIEIVVEELYKIRKFSFIQYRKLFKYIKTLINYKGVSK